MSPLPWPPCCTPPNADWLLPEAQPNLQLVSSHFNPTALQPEDFTRCGLAPVHGVAKRQTEYLAGRLCAHEALRLARGSGRFLPRGEDRAPVWPSGWVGAITHSDGWAAAVTGPSTQWAGLGLDVETLLELPRASQLHEHILTPEEIQAHWQILAPEHRGAYLSLAFSAKESLFKALYPLVGMRFYFQAARLILTPDLPPSGSLTLQLTQTLHPHWPAGCTVQGQYSRQGNQWLTLIIIPAPLTNA